MRTLLFLYFVLSLLFICTYSSATQDGDIVQEVLAALNTSVNPCDDFYAYSCGGWIAANSLPPSQSSYYKSFSSIEDRNKVVLKDILEDKYNKSMQVDPRLPTFYNSCMNLSAIEAAGLGKVKDMINTVAREIKNLETFFFLSGILLNYGVPSLVILAPVQDSKNPNFTIAQLSQGGLSLPDSTLYKDASLVKQYTQHVTNMFELFGSPSGMAAVQAKSVVAFESLIAAGTTTPDQLQNPFVTYNKINLDGLQKLAPKLPWEDYFSGASLFTGENITEITVDVPTFYVKLQAAILSQSPDTWKNYLTWSIIHTYAPYLTKAVVDEDFSFFGKILQGLGEPLPRSEQCTMVVDKNMGMLLGKYFVQAAFSGASKSKVSEMIESIEAQMHINLENIPWMDNITRANAIAKLRQVSNDVGYPSEFFTYGGLSIEANNFFQNVLEVFRWQFMFSMMLIQKPTNKELWEMTPATVNAYYDPTKNGMVFPAGILQRPFFDLTYAEPIYYGGMGFIMGHELTHGFDDQGRVYDGNGVLVNWWQPATSAKFDELTTCVINQYSGFEVLPGLFVNGNLTQGENIADMGGSKLAYLALQASIGATAMKQPSVVPGLTNEKLFFVSLAQSWCALQTPEDARIRIATDPHSPARFRVLGPLINHPYFANTYNCPVGSRMNPVKKCAIW